MKGERCYCGDPDCPSCGRAQGTYQERYVPPDTDELYEAERQKQVDVMSQGQITEFDLWFTDAFNEVAKEELERRRQLKSQVPCPECGGAGNDEFGDCLHCDGHGYVVEEGRI